MNSPQSLTILALILGGGAALLAASPAAAEPAQRSIGACRAEMLSQFPDGAVRNFRIGSIEGSSRRPRVSIFVTADRRYTFECATDGEGRIVAATLNPPQRDRQLAGQAQAAPGSASQ